MKLTLEVELPEEYDAETVEQMRKFLAVLAENARVMAAKQRMYGRGNIAKFGAQGVLIRCSDKVERLANMLFRGTTEATDDDSAEDAFRDLCNYGAIGMMCLRGDW